MPNLRCPSVRSFARCDLALSFEIEFDGEKKKHLASRLLQWELKGVKANYRHCQEASWKTPSHDGGDSSGEYFPALSVSAAARIAAKCFSRVVR